MNRRQLIPASRRVSSRPWICCSPSWTTLIAPGPGNQSLHARTPQADDLEEFLDGMLSGAADEEELLATAAR